MPYEFGEVVLVQFPFTSQMAFKQRPAVVVSNKAYNIARPCRDYDYHQPTPFAFRLG
jgi:mRNA-degrading endonuclease toxin of MazEF toxin-antitoxin module